MHRAKNGEKAPSFHALSRRPSSQHLHAFIDAGALWTCPFEFLWRLLYIGMIDELFVYW